jgi:hypothetical protein
MINQVGKGRICHQTWGQETKTIAAEAIGLVHG